jgi:hypothetical protein
MTFAGRTNGDISGGYGSLYTVITVGESTLGDVVELGVRLMGVITDAAAGL